MRNVVLRRSNIHNVGIFRDCEQFQEDSSNGIIYVSTKSHVYSFNLNTEEISEIVYWEIERTETTLVNFQFLFDSNEICAVLSSGAILLINIDDKKVEEVAFIGIECSAASWSSSLSILAVSDSVSLLLYDRDFQNITEAVLSSEERGKDELVTVGWGSKETQFQGSAGKLSARKNVEVVPTVTIEDSQKTYIHWRADDQFVFVSMFDQTKGDRRILTYSSDGELMSRFKNEKPFEEAFAVRPMGNYIATIAPCSENTREIMFFERNGELRHSYKIPCNGSSPCIGLKWNMESTILTIIYRLSDKDMVEMWSVSNYDWTRKWSYETSDRILAWDWSSEKPRTFLFSTTAGDICHISFDLEYTIVESMSVVVAIDELRITDLAKHPIPPPMCQFSVPMIAAPHAIASNKNSVTVIYTDMTMETYDISLGAEKITKTLKLDNSWKIISSFTYTENYKAVAVLNGNQIIEIDIQTGEIRKISDDYKNIVWLGYNDQDKAVYFTNAEGTTFKIEDHTSLRLFSTKPSDLYIIKFMKDDIFTLNTYNELYKNDRMVADAVSSFAIRDEYCLFITLQNKLMIFSGEEWKQLSEPRGVEIGSRLVDCSRDGTAVTMQMPRGNLETIHPRLFVVNKLRQLIDSLKYNEALKQMKKHRIDMNLLCDHNPEVFVENINSLINSSDADLINLFIASLSNDRDEFCILPVIENKVQSITSKLCDCVLNLDVVDRLKMFTVLLSALLKSSPPKTEEALKFIKQHTDEMCSLEKDSYSRKWLHHVSFFVNDKAMFNAALATYDLSLTVQVAEASNRDPKEYLPLLNELRKLNPEEYRRYRIDILREDWSGALAHISKLEDKFEEAVEFIKSKGIYAEALRIFKDSSKFKDIAKLVASYMETKAYWPEALSLYIKCGDFKKATMCSVNARDLDKFLLLAKRAELPEQEMKAQLIKLALNLKSSSHLKEAAKAYTYLGNNKEVVALLCLGGDWDEAVNVADSSEDLTTIIRENAKTKAQQLMEEASSRTQLILKFIKRLEIVRTNKEKLIQNLKDGIETGRDLEDCDAFSEAASTLSMLSRRTGKTSSSRASTTATVRKRKQIDRKKQSLKEGGEYEDSAIMLAVQQHYKWFNETSVTVKSLLNCLVTLNEFETGSHVQNVISEMRIFLQSQKHHIWPNKLEPKHLCGPVYALYSVDNVFTFPAEGGMPNVIVIEPEMIAPELAEDNWRLKILE